MNSSSTSHATAFPISNNRRSKSHTPTSNSERARRYNRLGQQEMVGENVDSAVEYFEKAIFEDNNFSSAWNNKSLALKRLGKINDALETCCQAIALDPASFKAWYNKGTIHSDMYQFAMAVECYQQALIYNEWYCKAWFRQGMALEALSNFDDAALCYLMAVYIDPQHEVSRNKLIDMKGTTSIASFIVEYLATNPQPVSPSSSNPASALKGNGREHGSSSKRARSSSYGSSHSDVHLHTSTDPASAHLSCISPKPRYMCTSYDDGRLSEGLQSFEREIRNIVLQRGGVESLPFFPCTTTNPTSTHVLNSNISVNYNSGHEEMRIGGGRDHLHNPEFLVKSSRHSIASSKSVSIGSCTGTNSNNNSENRHTSNKLRQTSAGPICPQQKRQNRKSRNLTESGSSSSSPNSSPPRINSSTHSQLHYLYHCNHDQLDASSPSKSMADRLKLKLHKTNHSPNNNNLNIHHLHDPTYTHVQFHCPHFHPQRQPESTSSGSAPSSPTNSPHLAITSLSELEPSLRGYSENLLDDDSSSAISSEMIPTPIKRSLTSGRIPSPHFT